MSGSQFRIKAAELGSAGAFEIIATLYQIDIGKTRRLLEVSAKKGCYGAHEYFGKIETEHGRIDTAIKHWNVAASAGSHDYLRSIPAPQSNTQRRIGSGLAFSSSIK